MREIKAVADAHIDLKPFGYIPGTNFFYCSDCSREPYDPNGNWPHSGASNSTRCVRHALDARTAELRALEGQLICEFGRNPIELTLSEQEAEFGRTLRTLVVSAIFGVIVIIILAIAYG